MGGAERVNRCVRSIGNLPGESQARLFGDYLLTQGIRSEVEVEADGSCLIWVLDDEQIDAARGFLERFRQNPTAPEFARKAADAERLRAEEEKAQADWRKRVHNRKRVFPGMIRYGAGPLTYLLVVLSVVMAVYSKAGTNEDFLRHFFISYPVNGESGFLPEVAHGEWWRLLTPIFIHFGIGHIVFNMMWLFQLGSMIESAQGTGRFALLIVLFALLSNLAQYKFGGPGFGGMSGVNYGLIGYIWIRGRTDPGSGLHLDKPSVIFSVAWFFLCLTGWAGSVANYAHGAGLLAGMAWGWVSAKIALRNL